MNVMVSVALSCLNIPYRWSGKNPLSGFDCSGLIEWILDSVGMSPPGVASAQDLYHHFMVEGRAIGEYEQTGALIFYGKSVNEITHISFMINDYQVIESGGGDHTTINDDIARAKSACVRIRPVSHRRDIVARVLPHYHEWIFRL